VTVWLRLHAHALAEALRRFSSQAAGSLVAVLVLGVAMALPMAAAVALRSAGFVAATLEPDPYVNVYLSLDATAEDARRVEAALRADPITASTRFVPRAAAFEEMKSTTHLAQVLAAFDRNPLPDAFTVRLRTTDAEKISASRLAWSKLARVDQVTADFEWAERLARWIRFGDRVLGAVAIALGAAVTFLVAHLIRLQVVSRREEIELSQLIGATAADVRRPFLYHGAVQALAGAVAALALTGAGAAWLASEMRALTPQYLSDLKIVFLTPEEAFGILVAAVLLGLGGSWWAVGRELRQFSAPPRNRRGP